MTQPSDETRDDVDETMHASEWNAAPLGTGSVVGAYRLLEELGRGGFGVVYLAEQQAPVRRRVALKMIVLGMDTRAVIARFEAERQALALMDHPNVARVFDAGATEAGRPYFVMEHVPGVPITEHCDRHRLGIRGRLELFIQVCDAIQHAHQKGIIHRDVKPSNVLVALREGSPVVKVIDFGVAKAVDHRLTDKTVHTARGQLIGTPEYMSPEQAESTGQDIDTRADVYSLGVLLYELLTGMLPFDADVLRRATPAEIHRIIREQEPPRPSTRLSSLGDASASSARNRSAGDSRTLERAIRGELDWITMKALEKDRTRRYGGASELAADVRRYLDDEPVAAGPPSQSYRLRKFARRNRGGLAVAALVVAALVTGLGAAGYGLLEAKARGREAAVESRRKERALEFIVGLMSAPAPSAGGADVRVVDALASLAEQIEPGLADDPALEIEIRLAAARIAFALGRYDDAIAHDRRAETLARSTGDQGALAAALIGQGDALAQAERGDAALAPVRDALEVLDAMTPSPRALRADALHALGEALVRLRDPQFDEAGEAYRAAQAIRVADFGPESREAAISLVGLGTLDILRGEPDTAVEQLERARRILLDVAGPDDYQTTAATINLGYILTMTGRGDEALALYRDQLARARARFSPGHPAIGVLLNNLAASTAFTDAAQAEAYAEEAVAINAAQFGDDHFETAKSRFQLGQARFLRGDPTGAAAAIVPAVPAHRRRLGDAHPQTMLVMMNLAQCYYHSGQLAEAEPWFRQLYEIRREHDGAGHAETQDALRSAAVTRFQRHVFDEVTEGRYRAYEAAEADAAAAAGATRKYQVRYDLVILLRRMERFDEAAALAGEMCDRAAATEGERRDFTPLRVMSLIEAGRLDDANAVIDAFGTDNARGPVTDWLRGAALLAAGDAAAALAPLERADAARRETGLPSNRHNHECDYGAALAAAGREAEALPLLREAWEAFSARFGPADWLSRRAASRLAAVHRARGEADEAAAWEARATPAAAGAPSG